MRRRCVGLVACVALLGVAVLWLACVASAQGPSPLPYVPDPAAGFPSEPAAHHPVLLAEGWTAPVNVSNSPGPSGSPSLAVDSRGTVHLVWYDNMPDNWDILYSNRPLAGQWSSPENVSANASYSLVPVVMARGDDTVDVAWQDYGGPRIAWQGTLLYKSREPGGDFGPPEAISATSGFGGYPEVRDPAFVADSKNTVHLVWAGNTSTGYRIFYARKPLGGLWTFPAVVNPGWGTSFRPHLAVDSSDRLHLVWQETLLADTQADIYYASLGDGGMWTTPVNVSRDREDSVEPHLLVDSAGTLHVVWRSDTGDPYHGEIMHAQKRPGQAWSAGEDVSLTPGDSAGPVMVQDSLGTFHLVWYDNTPGNWEILYATKAIGGAWTAGRNISQTPGRSGRPALFFDRRGSLHVAWADDTPGDFDIYYSTKAVPAFTASYKAAPAVTLEGDLLSYRLLLRNPSGLAVSLVLTDRVPAETDVIPGSAWAGSGVVSIVGDEVRWQGFLPPSGQIEVRFLVRVKAGIPVGTVIRNQAELSEPSGTTIVVAAVTRVMAARVLIPIVQAD